MKNDYDKMVKNIQPLSFQEIAVDWEKNSKEWYHATLAIEDLPLVLAEPDLKIYAWCRCNFFDGDSTRLQWHGLLHFPRRKYTNWKTQLYHKGIGFLSTKNEFRRVSCLDNVVGVLRYIACDAGPKHKHYDNRLIEPSHQHERGNECCRIRKDISTKISSFIDLTKKYNWTKEELHDNKNCLCRRSKVRIKYKNKKPGYRNYEADFQSWLRNKETLATKDQIINTLSEMDVS